MKNNFQLFDDYIFDYMTTIERLAFEVKLESDPELKHAFEIYQGMLAVIREDGREELRKRIIKVLAKKADPGRRRAVPVESLKKIGVLFIFIIVWLSGYLGFFHKPAAGYLFERYYIPYFLHGTVRGPDLQEQSLKLFYRAYQQGLYEEASLLVYDGLDELPMHKPHVLLAYGCTLMSIGDYATALDILKLPAVANNSFTSDQSHWYRALCLLQLDQPEACVRLLSPLAENPDADQHVEARKLLRRLPHLNKKTK